MDLFNQGDFTLHSGKESKFKIDCDALTQYDLDALAYLVSQKFKFGHVWGVPKGGTKFARLLNQYERGGNPNILIVDDVVTTGDSMKRSAMARFGPVYISEPHRFIFLAIFGRDVVIEAELPIVHTIFQLNPMFRDI